ncbi:nitric-oxide reductase [Cutibacterium acnes JCM 18918]|nr:nitric-oxide reductase [Cutibacterium acnes JCM 18918]
MLTYVLLGAVAFVVFGSLTSEALSVYGVSWAKGPVFGQQWEYIDLSKMFQLLLTLGMFLWVFIIWRAMHTRMRAESFGNMPWVFFLLGPIDPDVLRRGSPRRDAHSALGG